MRRVLSTHEIYYRISRVAEKNEQTMNILIEQGSCLNRYFFLLPHILAAIARTVLFGIDPLYFTQF
jgi:hypothetical protein